MSRTGVSASLQAGYDEQYDDSMTAWRELGGKYKAERILELAAGSVARKVLDCGAGEGSVLSFLDRSGQFDELYGIDISSSGVAQVQKRNLRRLVEVQKFDGYEIPYPDGFFDLAYATHVIEHVEHPRLLLRELARVSKRQIMEVPLDYRMDCDRHVEGQLSIGHINIYTPSTFRFLIKSEGFEILDERLSRLSRDVIRYAWYNNDGRRFDLEAEIGLLLAPLRHRYDRWRQGALRHDELSFDAITVLTRAAGALSIL
jgi:ubiquinone/menaquinone biosynthesis C-methylase UbiE